MSRTGCSKRWSSAMRLSISVTTSAASVRTMALPDPEAPWSLTAPPLCSRLPTSNWCRWSSVSSASLPSMEAAGTLSDRAADGAADAAGRALAACTTT
ncbi:hypothetical protein FQZ97_878680 [compost metagenome]